MRIYASILVERPGQKEIVVGRQGQMIKAIGTAARLDLEEYLGRRVYLDLNVRLEPDWREDKALLASLTGTWIWGRSKSGLYWKSHERFRTQGG